MVGLPAICGQVRSMSARILFSVIESSSHPNFSSLYQRLQFEELRIPSIRKSMGALKQTQPDVVVAEFFYGYGNNYAGVNLGNLDVLLSSLQKYAPKARVIVLVDKSEMQYAIKLGELFPLYAIEQQPLSEVRMEALLGDL